MYAPSDAERPTLESLAAKYNCPPTYLRTKASEEDWRIEAERYLQTVEQKRQNKKSEVLAGDLAEWDVKVFKAAQAGMALLYSRLKFINDATNRGEDPPGFRSTDDMARALERLHKIGRAALGEVDTANINIKIDYSKLTTEQLERIAAGDDPRDVLK